MDNMTFRMNLPNDTNMDVVRFECPTCGKIFSNGQGLGGHKRVHMEKRRNKRDHQTMAAEAEAEAPPAPADQEMGEKTPFSCPVCQQCFRSEKSLHGHMRKHPNRGWRGMKPPTPAVDDEEEEVMAPIIAAVANELLALPNSQPPTAVQDSVLSQDSARGESSRNIPNKAHKLYVCDPCAKAFKTYHAMGGHKSQHGPPGGDKPVYMEQPEGSGMVDGGVVGEEEEEEENGKGSKLVFNIDLNELPPSDDDDETSS
ncbi:hypothetical protein C2S52_016945 [Perilla frutescens var. hirtella]|nr:hypothetical protein C2S52_016945 [Perilla frutescens var. hirtella]